VIHIRLRGFLCFEFFVLHQEPIERFGFNAEIRRLQFIKNGFEVGNHPGVGQPALAASRSEILHGTDFSQVLFKRAEVFSDFVLVKHFFGFEPVQPQGLRQSKVSKLATAIKVDEKTLLRLSVEVKALCSEPLLDVLW
jgi:hypothetical protein